MTNLEDNILSPTERAEIVAQRRKQWAAELFAHRLNCEAAGAAGVAIDPQTAAAIDTLEAAIVGLAHAQARLDAAATAAAPIAGR